MLPDTYETNTNTQFTTDVLILKCLAILIIIILSNNHYN